MGLETATYLHDLVATNPVGSTDAVSQGDDHIKLLKATLQATFPAMAGAAWRVQAKASGYTVIATDNMTVFNCTGALTLALTAAATLGNKFMVFVHANAVDVVIDPNGAETVNGVATVTLLAGRSCVLVCNGSSWFAFEMPALGSLVIGSTVQAYDVNTLKSNATKTLTVGYTATEYDAGTKSTGTFTPDPALGNFQKVVNNGAHTLAPPSSSCTMILQVTNGASAGTITTSGFTKVTGTAPGTTNGDDFLAFITRVNGFSHLAWQALQ